MQASGIIGVLGAAIGIGPLVPHEPWPMAIYLASLTGACGCIMVLAALDAWATRQYFARLRNEQLTAQIKLARACTRPANRPTPKNKVGRTILSVIADATRATDKIVRPTMYDS